MTQVKRLGPPGPASGPTARADSASARPDHAALRTMPYASQVAALRPPPPGPAGWGFDDLATLPAPAPPASGAEAASADGVLATLQEAVGASAGRGGPTPEAAPTPQGPQTDAIDRVYAAAGAAPAETTRPTLRWGSRGQDVVELQSLLNRTDEVATELVVDGIFGPQTHKAVTQFQAAHPPLAVDGIVGPATWPRLEGTRVEAQDPTVVARKLFDRGADAYDRGLFALAYDFFTSADEHTHRKGLTFSRAQALRRLGGRRAEAIALYEQYIAEGGERSAEAAVHAAELRGPGATGDEATDVAAARALFDKGAAHYEAGEYAHAYDEFTKAEEIGHRKGLTFSRAQALRRLGGRREEAIALYEQYIAEGGERSAEAAAHAAELRGPGATGDAATDVAVARALFDKGAAHYDAHEYAHAYDEFTKADEIEHRKGLTFSRAQALRNLGGRRAEAIALYEQYLAEGGERAEEAAFYADELRQQGAISQRQRV